MRSKWLVLGLTFIILFAFGGSYMVWKEKYGGGIETGLPEAVPLDKVKTIAVPENVYDVIVVGTDPEGIAGAVSAARNGLKTLLVDGHNRDILGGLMTLGWLNSLDNSYDPDKQAAVGGRHPVLNNGIFKEWYDKVEGTSFDVVTAANAFNDLVAKEPNIDVVLMAQSIEPVLMDGKDGRKVLHAVDITLADGTKKRVETKAVLDATQDADLAAAAGAPFTVNREDLGDPKTNMAVTVVFRLKNADSAFWGEVKKRLKGDGNPDSDADEHSAWGYAEMQKYVPLNKDRVKMRGLNIGRQNDHTILINSMQIFGVDPLDPKSRAEAFGIAEKELPNVLSRIKELYPEFRKLEFDGLAPELYVRESRHLKAETRLTAIDLLENRDEWDRIAFGSYPVDIQRTSPDDWGAVAMKPEKYAVPFRSIIPQQIDGLLVISRSAGYDSIPHGSARTIPVGMAVAQSAGAAAKVAIDHQVTFQEMSQSKDLVAEMQSLVNKQGIDLLPYAPIKLPYMEHKAYPGLKAAVYLGIANGGYNNDFKLDEPTNPVRFVNHFYRIRQVYGQRYMKTDPATGLAHLTEEQKKGALTLTEASYIAALSVGLEVTPDQALEVLQSKRAFKDETLKLISDPNKLTNGDAFLLIKDLVEALVNVRF